MRAAIPLFALLLTCASNCIVFREIDDVRINAPSSEDASGDGSAGDTPTDAYGGDESSEESGGDSSADGSCPVDARSCPVTCAPSGCVIVEQVAANAYQSCARMSDGSVRCWGLGNPRPTPVIGVEGAADLAVGDHSACAVLADGTARCWGDGSNGELGDGSKGSSSAAIAVSGITTATKITVGHKHACALLSDETVRCWGLNSVGQLGDGTKTDRLTPTAVALRDVVEVSAGVSHTCARQRGGRALCWGSNQFGQVATTGGDQPTPVPWGDGSLTAAVRAGPLATCAVLLDRSVSCTGWLEGGLGDGTTYKSSSPVRVSGLTSVDDLAVAEHHACALAAGAVWCWGFNTHGQLGDGTVVNRYTPVKAGIDSALSIAAGYRYTLVRRANDVRGWGENETGTLGTGMKTPNELTPVAVVW